MSDDKEEKNVYTFTKRYQEHFNPNNRPTWRIKYVVKQEKDEVVLDTVYAIGYITSLMPLFMVSSSENTKTLSDVRFLLPIERLIDCSRVEDNSPQTNEE